MKTTIYCKPTSQGIHSFYLKNGNEEYFLFCQSFRKGVQDYYGCGVHLDKARDYSKSNHDEAIRRTMTKLPIYIKYIEKEYGVTILNKTKKKNDASYKSRRCA